MLSAAATRETTIVIVLVIDVNRADRVLIGSPARSDSLALWHHLSILDWLVVPVLTVPAIVPVPVHLGATQRKRHA